MKLFSIFCLSLSLNYFIMRLTTPRGGLDCPSTMWWLLWDSLTFPVKGESHWALKVVSPMSADCSIYFPVTYNWHKALRDTCSATKLQKNDRSYLLGSLRAGYMGVIGAVVEKESSMAIGNRAVASSGVCFCFPPQLSSVSSSNWE